VPSDGNIDSDTHRGLDGSRDDLARALAAEEARSAATAQILRAVGVARGDVQPVLDTIARSATELSGAKFCNVWRVEDGQLHHGAGFGFPDAFMVDYVATFPKPVTPDTMTGRVLAAGKTMQIANAKSDDYHDSHMAHLFQFSHALGVPIPEDDGIWGVIVLGWQDGETPADRDIAMIESFADQAAIAIGNARLFNDTRQALAQQTATSEILQVINAATSDLQPVFDLIVQKAVELCGARFCVLDHMENEHYRFSSQHGFEGPALETLNEMYRSQDKSGHVGYRVFQTGQIQHLVDAQAGDYFSTRFARDMGFRHVMGVPVKVRGAVYCAIVLGWPDAQAPHPGNIELVQTFADQASIAIENARLLRETEARTAEVTEALEYQTATSEVLDVISRSPDAVQPVLEAILDVAARLCAPKGGYVALKNPDTGHFDVQCLVHAPDEIRQSLMRAPIVPGQNTVTGRVAALGERVYIADVFQEDGYEWIDNARRGGYLSALGVPLIRNGETIGIITVAHGEVDGFSQRQIDLLETFATQAVIAIENVRLFNETNEALERQTATAEVLEVISNSVEDTQPVFEKIIDSCEGLVPFSDMSIGMVDNHGMLDLRAIRGKGAEKFRATRPTPIADTIYAEALQNQKTMHYPDVLGGETTPDLLRRVAEKTYNISGVITPLMWKGTPVGALFVVRDIGVRKWPAFTAKEIELLESFADQAVIAIQNARMFREVQARTAEVTEALEQQRASAEILSVISQSVEDTQPVFEKILDSCRTCSAARNSTCCSSTSTGCCRSRPIWASTKKELLETFPAPWEITPRARRSARSRSPTMPIAPTTPTRPACCKRWRASPAITRSPSPR
jgi:GAF domain-containing protein